MFTLFVFFYEFHNRIANFIYHVQLDDLIYLFMQLYYDYNIINWIIEV